MNTQSDSIVVYYHDESCYHDESLFIAPSRLMVNDYGVVV